MNMIGHDHGSMNDRLGLVVMQAVSQDYLANGLRQCISGPGTKSDEDGAAVFLIVGQASAVLVFAPEQLLAHAIVDVCSARDVLRMPDYTVHVGDA